MAKKPAKAPVEVTEGDPKDGEVFSENVEALAEGEPKAASIEPVKLSEMDSIRGEMAALRRENEQLRRSVPPAQPAKPVEPDAEVDWDKLLYENPKEAFRLHGEVVKNQVKAELTAQYQRDQGAQSFWRDFYVKHPDLREDHDLVQQTLESNFVDISPLPVSQALEKLALLTRERIVRYSGRAKSPTKRVVVEGSGRPLPVAAPSRDNEITSLSDLIRANSRRRRGAA